jgi:hypothetical protein
MVPYESLEAVMFVDYTPEQQAFRDEIRAYLDELMTNDLRAELDDSDGGGPLYFKAMERLGADRRSNSSSFSTKSGVPGFRCPSSR